ncbi:MAG: D-glycerate dehydrogenase [Cyclobacteriaceae bacterium]|nr:D-glycerate dehydrogenase [Cyclobacteriaceae bacterium]
MRVYVSRDFPRKGIDMLLDQGIETTVWEQDRPQTREELIRNVKGYDALFCASTDKIDSHFLRESKHLKMISQFAAGYDNIDLKEATRQGIIVANTPDVMRDATADIAFTLMLAVSRKICYMHKKIIRGEWDYFRPKANLGRELSKATIGIVGMGSIGMEMAKRCKAAYEMEILYTGHRQNEFAEKLYNARKVSLEELCQKSDVISVHCPLTDETRGMFDMSWFKKMKPSAIFINTARGTIHREEDLIEALQKGYIWGAGLDVTDPEPMDKDNPLLEMENVAVVPHIGSSTIQARDAMSRLAAENILDFVAGKKIKNLLNPEVLEG